MKENEKTELKEIIREAIEENVRESDVDKRRRILETRDRMERQRLIRENMDLFASTHVIGGRK